MQKNNRKDSFHGTINTNINFDKGLCGRTPISELIKADIASFAICHLR